MAPQVVLSIDQLTNLIEADKPVLLKLFLPTCSNCVSFTKDTWTQLEVERNTEFAFADIDVSPDSQLASDLQDWVRSKCDLEIESVPTVMFI